MVRMVGDELPEWGALPIEAHMIVRPPLPESPPLNRILIILQRRWDHQSTEHVSQQRLQLVSEFLAIEEIPREYYDKEHPDFRLATQEEVSKILLTWRSDEVRKLAFHIWERQNSFPFVVRAWYEPRRVQEHERKMAEWINVFRNLNSNKDYTIIEGRELFILPQSDDPNYWRCILAQLPELAGPELIRSSVHAPTRWDGIPPWHDNLLEKFKEDIAYNKKKNPRLWKLDPEHVIEACASQIHRACAYHPIILLDKEAFYGGKPLLMYMDSHTNVIRKIRIDLNELSLINICEDWFNHKVDPWLWQKSEVGAVWKINGEMGQPVYQLTAEDMAPPAGEYLEFEGKCFFIPEEDSASPIFPSQSSSTAQASSTVGSIPFRPRRVTKRVSPRKRPVGNSAARQRVPVPAPRGLPLHRLNHPSTARIPAGKLPSSTEPPTPTEEEHATDEDL